VQHTVVAQGVNIRRSFGAVYQSLETVDGLVLNGQVKARLSVTVGCVRRRFRLEKSPHDVATVGDDAQV